MVNVEDIYAQFNYSIFDANAIHAYTQHAINNMGVRYILLVGGDTVDYRGYKAYGDIPFIPALFRAAHSLNEFVAVDPLYADKT